MTTSWRANTQALCLSLVLLAPAAQGQQPTAADRLHRAQAAFALADGQVAAGLAALRRRHTDTGPAAALGYARYGLPAQARRALSGWGKNPRAAAAWLALAHAEYAAGEYRRAEHSLVQLPGDLPVDLARTKASLLARSQLRQGDNDQAALALSAQQLRAPLDDFDTYNHAIAWLRGGDVARGTAALNELGGYRGPDRIRAALADQANLALGYYFLRQAQGGLARTALQRIRLQGPFAEKGMVGLGWAELAPGGGLQRMHVRKSPECTAPQPGLWSDSTSLHSVPRRECRDEPIRNREDVLAGQPARTDIAAAFRRAAVTWSSAADGDAATPPVQEALVNLPYALARAGDAERAREAYRRAIDRLESADARYSADIATLAGRSAPLEGNPAGPPALSDPRGLPWLQDQPDRLRERLDAQSARLAALTNPPSQHDLLTALGSALQRLRQNGADQARFASPPAAERGLFIAALSNLGDTGRAPPDPAPMRARIAQMADRVAALQRELDQALLARQRNRLEQRRQDTRKRLQQARIGQAQLLE